MENKFLEVGGRMNLVEQYSVRLRLIEEILSEKIEINPYTNKPCCVVKMITDCYGCISEVEEIFDVEEWEQIKKQGYY
jgi:hypothetical protein